VFLNMIQKLSGFFSPSGSATNYYQHPEGY